MADKTFVFVGDTEVGSRLSQSLNAGGFSTAASLSDADVVFTYYETQQGLEDLYFDSKGLLQDTKEGALLVDLSPTTPSFARELYAVARVNERNTLDAPLVVRNIVEEDAFASCDNLMIFVGGEEESYEEAKPMLHAIARHVLYLGEAGCGQSAKVMATLQRASALIGVIESYATYINGDVRFDWEEVIDTLSIAGCVSPVNIAYIDAIRTHDFTGTYTVEILMELLAMVGGAAYNPAALALIFDDEDAAKRFGLDWSRAEGAYEKHDHDHDCDCGHDHSHEEFDEVNSYFDTSDGYPEAMGDFSAN